MSFLNMPLPLKTLIRVPQRSDPYLTLWLRLAGALGWGVIILFPRSPRKGKVCPGSHSLWPWSWGSGHNLTLSTGKWQYSTICVFTSYISRRETFIIPLLKGFMKWNWTCKIFQVAIIKVYWSIFYFSGSFRFPQTLSSAWISKDVLPSSYLPIDPGDFTAPSPWRGIYQSGFQLNLYLAANTKVK